MRVLQRFCSTIPDSSPSLSIDRKITGKRQAFIAGDVQGRSALDRVFPNHPIDAVIHLAGPQAVGDSVERPLDYFLNNVVGSAILFDVMRAHTVRSFRLLGRRVRDGRKDAVNRGIAYLSGQPLWAQPAHGTGPSKHRRRRSPLARLVLTVFQSGRR